MKCWIWFESILNLEWKFQKIKENLILWCWIVVIAIKYFVQHFPMKVIGNMDQKWQTIDDKLIALLIKSTLKCVNDHLLQTVNLFVTLKTNSSVVLILSSWKQTYLPKPANLKTWRLYQTHRSSRHCNNPYKIGGYVSRRDIKGTPNNNKRPCSGCGSFEQANHCRWRIHSELSINNLTSRQTLLFCETTYQHWNGLGFWG